MSMSVSVPHDKWSYLRWGRAGIGSIIWQGDFDMLLEVGDYECIEGHVRGDSSSEYSSRTDYIHQLTIGRSVIQSPLLASPYNTL